MDFRNQGSGLPSGSGLGRFHLSNPMQNALGTLIAQESVRLGIL